MFIDDVIYVTCLLACIGIGSYIRRKLHPDKILFTAIGCCLVLVVSGFHSLHCFLSWFFGSAAIIYLHPSKCHLVTFIIMFGYLGFYRLGYLFGIPAVPGHTNMIQMVLTLKVSGLAFEKTAAWKKLQQRENQMNKESGDGTDTVVVEITDYDIELQNINFIDVFHYSFNYIGVLTGPYYRYRTYRDYFDFPFKQYAPCLEATLEKLKYAFLFCALHLITEYIWSQEYALSDEFYEERSFFYRLMYVWPMFFVFRTRIYTALMLSECVCTMAGFGAYPDECNTSNGQGPRIENYYHLKRNAAEHKYNFTTVVNTRLKEVERSGTMRESMKNWNVCIQYWLAANIYKLFPSKKYRTYATLLVSAYWHGFRPGHYFCLMGAPFYVPIEDIWIELVRKDATGLKRRVIDFIFWLMTFFSLSYLGTAFVLASFTNIWKYYSSIYHFGYVLWATLFVLGVFISKIKKIIESSEMMGVHRSKEASGGDSILPLDKKTAKIQ